MFKSLFLHIEASSKDQWAKGTSKAPEARGLISSGSLEHDETSWPLLQVLETLTVAGAGILRWNLLQTGHKLQISWVITYVSVGFSVMQEPLRHPRPGSNPNKRISSSRETVVELFLWTSLGWRRACSCDPMENLHNTREKYFWVPVYLSLLLSFRIRTMNPGGCGHQLNDRHEHASWTHLIDAQVGELLPCPC